MPVAIPIIAVAAGAVASAAVGGGIIGALVGAGTAFAIVHRQRLWDQIGDLNNGGFLAHRNPKESEDEPEILRPTRPCAS